MVGNRTEYKGGENRLKERKEYGREEGGIR